MNYYDKETNIIKLLQTISCKEIYFVNKTKDAYDFFNSLYCAKRFYNWIDSSAKNKLPPDFFSDKYQYMLEVMRVDDYSRGNNSPNALESVSIKRMDDLRRQNGFPSLSKSNVDVLLIPDMSKASENGYTIYIENFKRIVNKHIEKIKNYRQNHPGYKLGFLIFDESAGYIEASDRNVEAKIGDAVYGLSHVHFRDENLMKIFEGIDVDVIIWMTPCKNFYPNPRIYPQICIIDMKRNGGLKTNFIRYDMDKMFCLEVR